MNNEICKHESHVRLGNRQWCSDCGGIAIIFGDGKIGEWLLPVKTLPIPKTELEPLQVDKVAREMYEVCCYPDPTPFENIAEDDKRVWIYRAGIFCDKFGTTAVGKQECHHTYSECMACIKCREILKDMSAVGTGKQSMTPLQWFMTPNPLLGNVSPIEMIHTGRWEKLCKWIGNQIDENNHTLSPARSEVDEK